MKSLKSALELNVLIEMAVANCDFQQLLMADPLQAAQEYNRQMIADASPVCTLPRMEVEMLQRVAGVTGNFRQFCQLLIEERDRMERDEQRRQLELVGTAGSGTYQPEPARALRSA
jgi:hypothetical protein